VSYLIANGSSTGCVVNAHFLILSGRNYWKSIKPDSLEVFAPKNAVNNEIAMMAVNVTTFVFGRSSAWPSRCTMQAFRRAGFRVLFMLFSHVFWKGIFPEKALGINAF
jgi:hypothetical protein